MSDLPDIDPYLWDGSGEPDADVARLESLLGRFAHDAAPARPAAKSRPRRWRTGLALLAAAALLLVFWRPFGGGTPDVLDGYRVEWAKGVTVARIGERVETADARALMKIGDIGEVEVSEGSVVRVEDVGAERHALFLERGSLHARIDAEPRVFQVGSPAGLAVDLGCEYLLSVEDDGSVALAVLTGQVSLEYEGVDVYVPAEASTRSRPGSGPEPPFFDDADPELREAVAAVLDAAQSKFPGKAAKQTLDRIVSFRDRDDALPIFALLFDGSVDEFLRGAIYDRFEQVFQRPPGVTRDEVLACDPDARAAWLEILRPRWRRQGKR